jgi:2-dehydropantoate 2-reductase
LRVLVVGAGSIGGYFGGRLLEANRDVTFLVRPRRAAELNSAGLVIRSPHGDAVLKNVPTVLSKDISSPFDLIILSCKAYDLDGAMDSLAPAVGRGTVVLPMLNGMRHLDALDQRFGQDKIFGGLCAITTTLNERREIVQLMPVQSLTFGARTPSGSQKARAIAELFSVANFDSSNSDDVVQDMWEKWIFIACLSAATCLLRGSIGSIVSAPGGREFLAGLVEECSTIATAHGHRPTGFFERAKGQLTLAGSPMTASMFRDMNSGARTEADHVIGDLVARAETANVAAPKLKLAYTALRVHDQQRGN